jgi:hypothetical protein
MANVTDATMFARQLPIAFQLLLALAACTLLGGVAHGCGRIPSASDHQRTDNAPEHSPRIHESDTFEIAVRFLIADWLPPNQLT